MVGYIFGGNTGETPESINRKRAIARALMQSRAPTSVGEGISALGDGIVSAVMNARADAAEKKGMETAALDFAPFASFGGDMPVASPAATPSAPVNTLTPPEPIAGTMENARRIDRESVPGYAGMDMKSGIRSAAEALGIAPVDLATAISYETAGTFDPTKRGPTTQWGQHRGLIQFGEPQAKQYGVDWSKPLESQLGPEGAVVKYLRDRGVKPGMGLLDVYSTINAGAPGLYNRSDANNGGAPGTVRDKVEQQMGDHRQKALALFGEQPSAAADAVNAMAEGGQLMSPPAADPAAFPPLPMPDMPQQQNAAVAPPMEVAAGGGRKRGGIIDALLAGTQQQAGPGTDYFPAAPAPAGQPGLSRQQIVRALSNQFLSPEQRAIAQDEYQRMRQQADPAYQMQMEKSRLELDALRNPTPGFKTLTDDEEKAAGLDPSGIYQLDREGKLYTAQEPAKAPTPTDDMREYQAAQNDPAFAAYLEKMKKAGAQNITLGGGDNKQVFDAMAESAGSARAAVTGLNSLREAKAAVEGGIISGAGADARLGLQKVGALLGVADPSVIENTETFRAAIAPQVAAMMKATVGSTQISNADREFAQQAAGGSISLDERSIRRLVDIMERAGTAAVQSHMDRLNKVYPEGGQFDRERALFGVTLPEPAAPAAPAAPPSLDDLLRKYGG